MNSNLDHNSPYYIVPEDGPETILKVTNVIFQGDNYFEWSNSVQLYLLASRKLGFVDGTIPRPTDAMTLQYWHCVQATLVTWILHTIDSSIKKTIPYFKEAKPLWDAIKARFEVRHGIRKQEIKLALARCRQSNNMSVGEYLGLLQRLWDELATYNPVPTCTCGQCTCGIGDKWQAQLDEEHLYEFLFGINGELYGHARSSLLAQQPLPSLNGAYQVMIQEEDYLRSKSERDEVMAYSMKTNARASTRSNNRHKLDMVCSYCCRPGHEIANCFAKNGFPDWWGARPKG